MTKEAELSDQDGQRTEATAGIDTSAVDPAEFARNIASVPDEQLAEAMSGEMRELILNEIFGRMEEHFRADVAQNVDAVIHWQITREGGDPDRFEIVIDKGTCTLNRAPEHEPRVSFAMDGVTFLRLVTGNVPGPTLFMSGKLKIEGDLMFAAQVQGFFRLPSGSPSPGAFPPPAPDQG